MFLKIKMIYIIIYKISKLLKMSYLCGRCNGRFKSKKYLENHIQSNKIPCDFFCDKCGWKGANQSAIVRHLREPCVIKETMETPVVKTQVLPLQNNIVFESLHEQSQKQIERPIRTINMTNMENIIEYGVCATEQEQDELFKTHSSTLAKLIIDYMLNQYQPDNGEHRELLNYVFKMFFSNETTPEFINIIDYKPDNINYFIYNGQTYVKDNMDKSMRRKRMLQLIIMFLTKLSEVDDIIHSVIDFINQKFIPYIRRVYVENNTKVMNDIHQFLIDNYSISQTIDYARINHTYLLSYDDYLTQYQQFLTMHLQILKDHEKDDYSKYKLRITKMLKKHIVQ